jgi:hypothetical protein
MYFSNTDTEINAELRYFGGPLLILVKGREGDSLVVDSAVAIVTTVMATVALVFGISEAEFGPSYASPAGGALLVLIGTGYFVFLVLGILKLWDAQPEIQGIRDILRYAAATVPLVALLATVANLSGDLSSTPLRLILMAAVSLRFNEALFRSQPSKLHKNPPTLQYVKPLLECVSCLLVLAVFDFAPALYRSYLQYTQGPETPSCQDTYSADLPDLAGFTPGGLTHSTPSFAAANFAWAAAIFAVALLLAAASVMSSVIWYKNFIWSNKDPLDKILVAEVVTRGVILPLAASVCLVLALCGHVARMQFDPMRSTGRECADFMLRSVMYFSNVGIDFAGDCANGAMFPAHCAACTQSGFGVATIGEDAKCSAFVFIALATLGIVDGIISFATSVVRIRRAKPLVNWAPTKTNFKFK